MLITSTININTMDYSLAIDSKRKTGFFITKNLSIFSKN